MIRIAFVHSKAKFVPLAWLIRLVECAPYHHICFSFDFKGEEIVFDTNIKNGTSYTLREDYLREYRIVDEFGFNASEDQLKAFKAFCDQQIGKSYSFKQLAGTLLSRLFGMKKNVLTRGEDQIVCAEVCLMAIRALPEVFGDGKELQKENPDLVGLRVLNTYSNNRSSKRLI